MRNTLFATVAAVAMFAAVSANAATVYEQGPVAISGNGGSFGFGTGQITGVAGEEINVNFRFTVKDVDAAAVGAVAVENNLTPILDFSSFALYQENGAVDILLATGTFSNVNPSTGLLSQAQNLLVACPACGEPQYYVQTVATFSVAGNAAIAGPVDLAPAPAPVPVPAALPLMVSAIAAVGLLGARRKKA